MKNKIKKIILPSVIFLQVLFLISLKFTAWPEMLLWPYLIARGWLPYVNIAIAHTPHLIIDLAIFYKIFGTGILQLKIFTWILILGTDLLVYWLAVKIWNKQILASQSPGKKIALISLIAFAFWSLFYDGNGLWFDLMLAPLALVTFYLINKKNWFWAGVIWGLMFFTKQTAFWFLLPIGLELTKNQKIFIQVKNFAVGAVISIAVWLLALWIWGALPAFYNWAIAYGIFVLPRSSGQIQFPDLKTLLVSILPFAIIIPFYLKQKSKSVNLLVWMFAGILGAYPRFEFFHFQPAVPFLAMAIGLIFAEFKKEKGFIKTFLVVYLTGSILLFAGFFLRNWHEDVRFYENDVQDIAAYIKSNTKPNDKIFVMNWWDNIYALTDTVPAVDPWVPQLPWYQDLSGIQEKEVADLKNNMPKMIILNPYTGIGLSAYIPKNVYNYVQENYKPLKKIGGIDILILKP